MSKIRELLKVTEKDKFTVCSELDISLDEFEDLHELLKTYIDQSQHLPKEYDAAMITAAIVNNKANLQAAKSFIENYFRCKNEYAEALFNQCIPTSSKYQHSKKCTINVCIKNLTPEGHRVHYFKLVDPEGKAEDISIYLLQLVMMCELRGTYDFWSSTVMVVDMEELTYKILFKISSQWALLIKDIMESMHFRIHAIHIINGPPIIDKFLEVVKVILPAKLLERLVIHKNSKSLLQAIPNDCLPKDLGGLDSPICKLRDDWNAAMDELKPYFYKLREAKSTKKYEFDENQMKSLGLGVDGSFRKLAID